MNIIKWLPLSAWLVLITGFQTRAQALVDTSKIHLYLSIQQKQLGFNGVVCIAREGRILYEGSFGTASYELEVPVGTTTVFKIVSISKPFTAMLVLLACGEGRLLESDSIGFFTYNITFTAGKYGLLGSICAVFLIQLVQHRNMWRHRLLRLHRTIQALDGAG